MATTTIAKYCLVYWIRTGEYTVQSTEHVENADMLWNDSIVDTVPFTVGRNPEKWKHHPARILSISNSMRTLENEAEKIIRDIVDSEVSTTNPDLTSCEPEEQQSDQVDDTDMAASDIISSSPSRSVPVDDNSNVGDVTRQEEEEEEEASPPTETRESPGFASPAIPDKSDPRNQMEAPEAGSCLSNAGTEATTCTTSLRENQQTTAQDQQQDQPAAGLMPSAAGGTTQNNFNIQNFAVPFVPFFQDFSALLTHSQSERQLTPFPKNMEHSWMQNVPPILYTTPPSSTPTSMVPEPSTSAAAAAAAAAPVNDRQEPDGSTTTTTQESQQHQPLKILCYLTPSQLADCTNCRNWKTTVRGLMKKVFSDFQLTHGRISVTGKGGRRNTLSNIPLDAAKLEAITEYIKVKFFKSESQIREQFGYVLRDYRKSKLRQDKIHLL